MDIQWNVIWYAGMKEWRFSILTIPNCGEMSSDVKGETLVVTRLRTKVVVEGSNSALFRRLLITSLVCFESSRSEF